MKLFKSILPYILLFVILISVADFLTYPKKYIGNLGGNFYGVFFAYIEESQNDIDYTVSDFVKPEIVKGVYATSWSISRQSFINNVIDLARTTEINTVIIDIKDYSGQIAYYTDVAKVKKYNAEYIKIPDIKSVIQQFHNNGVYVIARIAVFQDPVLANARPDLAVHSKSKLNSTGFSNLTLWIDNLKLAWIDPASKEAWDYNVDIAKDAVNKGFDEINFDYIRFPSDGALSDMNFPNWDRTIPKHLVIKDFFKYLRQELPDVVISADLFGLVCNNRDDLGIGQVIEDAYEFFDFVSPMVYPSHYASGFLGYTNPADYPYQVVRDSMDKAFIRMKAFETTNGQSAKIRPWLQDFNMGATYTASMVKSQIEATYDALGDDYVGFMLWNSRNVYTKGALEPAY